MELGLENLVVGFEKKQLNEPFSANFKAGNVYAILGQNGIGKSTLLKTIAGILDPIGGSCLWDGTNLQQLTPEQRAKEVAIVLTGRPFVADLTVEELIGLGRNPHKSWFYKESATDRALCHEAATICNCLPFLNKKAVELSDGQFQLVMLARAVAQDTPILLLDEPTTHLDPAKKSELLFILNKLAYEKGKLVLFSTHDVEFMFEAVKEVLVCTSDGFKLEHIDSIKDTAAINRIFPSKFLTYSEKLQQLKYR